MATSPSTSIYSRLRNLRPNLLRFFVDDASIQRSAFTLHRMVLTGNESRKDMEQCIAAGPIKCVHVAIVAACMLTFFSDLWCKASQTHRSGCRLQDLLDTLYSASHPPMHYRPRKLSRWGRHAVLVLIDIRLGIDGVNSIYYETMKVL